MKKKRSQRQEALAGLTGPKEVGKYSDQKTERPSGPASKDAVARVKARLLEMQQQQQKQALASKQRAAEVSVDIKSKTAAFKANQDTAPTSASSAAADVADGAEKKEKKHRDKKEKKHREKRSLAELMAKDQVKQQYSPSFFDETMLVDLQRQGYTLPEALQGLYEAFHTKQPTNELSSVLGILKAKFGPRNAK